MRQQPIPRDSWTEAQAVRLVRGLSSGQHHAWTGGSSDAFGPDVAEREADASRRAALTRAVEDEVIPRLLMARRPQRSARAAAEAQQQEADRIANLVAIVLAGTQSEATAYVEALRDGGSNTESLFLDLLAPTARELGRLWEEDLTTCADVTIGLVRLANIMRLLAGPFTGDTAAQYAGSPVLLAQMPGEQHGLGLAMVAHFFRRAGWCVQEERAASSADLIGIVHRNWFGLIGIGLLHRPAAAIGDRHSCHPSAVPQSGHRRARRRPALHVRSATGSAGRCRCHRMRRAPGGKPGAEPDQSAGRRPMTAREITTEALTRTAWNELTARPGRRPDGTPGLRV
jgi:hypothetical protein